MGETKNTSRKTKAHVDEKLAMSVPSRDLLEALAVECASKPSLDNTFQYAFALCKSDNPSELRYAVTILDGLIKEYKYQVDCMYGAATALYLLGNYDEARVSSMHRTNLFI
jgi:fission 1 protein